MGSRRGEGGKDQIKILRLAPRGERGGDGEVVTSGYHQAINGGDKGLEEAVTGENVREALLPIFAERAA